jgi:hypothetical protein
MMCTELTQPARLPTNAIETRPSSPLRSAATASVPSFTAASTASAYGSRAAPASVNITPARARSNIGTSNSFSSRSMRRLIAGCDRCSVSEARRKLFRRATATKVRIWSMSIGFHPQS